jgi:hypothetical protein
MTYLRILILTFLLIPFVSLVVAASSALFIGLVMYALGAQFVRGARRMLGTES